MTDHAFPSTIAATVVSPITRRLPHTTHRGKSCSARHWQIAARRPPLTPYEPGGGEDPASTRHCPPRPGSSSRPAAIAGPATPPRSGWTARARVVRPAQFGLPGGNGGFGDWGLLPEFGTADSGIILSWRKNLSSTNIAIQLDAQLAPRCFQVCSSNSSKKLGFNHICKNLCCI